MLSTFSTRGCWSRCSRPRRSRSRSRGSAPSARAAGGARRADRRRRTPRTGGNSWPHHRLLGLMLTTPGETRSARSAKLFGTPSGTSGSASPLFFQKGPADGSAAAGLSALRLPNKSTARPRCRARRPARRGPAGDQRSPRATSRTRTLPDPRAFMALLSTRPPRRRGLSPGIRRPPAGAGFRRSGSKSGAAAQASGMVTW